MMFNRRNLILSSAAAGLIAPFAASSDEARPRRAFAPGTEVPDFTEVLATAMAARSESGTLGNGEARKEDVLRAQEIFDEATGNTAYAVADYFRRTAGGALSGSRSFAEEWGVDMNPLIVRFFEVIDKPRVTPSGDCTAWCAAFVNTCLKISQKGLSGVDPKILPTRNALAASFLNWGYPTTSPKKGDVVVAHHDGHYHVALYSDKIGGKYYLLGGNQSPRQMNAREKEVSSCSVADDVGGKIWISTWGENYATYKFFTFTSPG